MKSRPTSSAMRASLRLSAQLPDQRSGTMVTARPDEQLAPNSPIFSRLALCIAVRSGVVTSAVMGSKSLVSLLLREASMLVGAVVGAGARRLGQHRRQGTSTGAMSTIPSSMTVIAIRSPGGPEMLVPEQRSVPQPGAGEVLVKVLAAGVNRPDVM